MNPSRYIAAGAFALLAVLSLAVSPWLAVTCVGLCALVIAEGFDA